MEAQQKIDGITYANMMKAGAMSLRFHEQEVNDLNVFPIPDGDTGSNMLLTIMGGVSALNEESTDVSKIARQVADGMLLSARGNSGVILSQLFDGIAKGVEGLDCADSAQFYEALKSGVDCAYNAVIEPTEGTILTVARVPLEKIKAAQDSIETLLSQYVVEAKEVLTKTPEMLPVLKKAGVVDSGGAGLIYVLEGMSKMLSGNEEAIALDTTSLVEKKEGVNVDLFTEDDVLEFGYCTEVLLRLQNAKTDIANFECKTVTDYLQTVGDSVVAVKTGSIVKLHVHTMTPDKVLAFCRRYGEFLSVKIENMSIQHNGIADKKAQEETEKKAYAVVAVCSGEGVKQMFLDREADVIVDGGQCMNPSTEDFIQAFQKVKAETIFVLPNNGNVILAAQQAAKIYQEANVLVLNSKTIGEGFVALSMMNPNEEDAQALYDEMSEAMAGVVTVKISQSVRDSQMSGKEIAKGDYIGFAEKDVIAASKDRVEAVMQTLDAIQFSQYDSCIVIKGKGVTDEKELRRQMECKYRRKEVYHLDGEQEIYDYILIIQ